MKNIKKPNFFIVGAPKCGTTAFYTYLKEHPDIFMSSIKEPQFFADDVLGDLRSVRTLDDYLNCFAAAEREGMIGEASVAYLGSRAALQGIKAFSPSAQIIIMLRSPIDVMYSEYSQRILDTREPSVSFEVALKAEEEGKLSPWRRQGGKVIGLSLRETVRFFYQVREYFQAFGREKIHVIIYDDLKKDTAGTYVETLRFLGVRPDFQPRFKVIHANKRVRSRQLQEFLIHPPQRMIARALLPQPIRRLGGNSLLRLNSPNTPRPPMNPTLRRSLQQELEADVERLSGLLDRDLTHWVVEPVSDNLSPLQPE
jgi:Sulfotransferase domain